MTDDASGVEAIGFMLGRHADVDDRAVGRTTTRRSARSAGGYPPGEIGETLRLPVRAVRDRPAAIIAGLEPIRTPR